MKSIMRETIAGADKRIKCLEANRDKLRVLKKQLEAQIAELSGDINDAYIHRDELQEMFDGAM